MERPVRQAQQRNWCFTVNNYTAEESDSIFQSIDVPFGKGTDVDPTDRNVITYIGVAEETGANGTPHLQGFLQLKRKGILVAAIA